jgi:hypothetical protein
MKTELELASYGIELTLIGCISSKRYYSCNELKIYNQLKRAHKFEDC